MIATKLNRSGVTSALGQRCSPARAARSPVVIGRRGRLLDSVAAEFRRQGVVSSYGGAPHISRRMSRMPHVDGQRDGADPSTPGKVSRPSAPSDASRPSKPSDASTPCAPTTPATIVIVDRTMIEFLFCDRTSGRGVVRTFDRIRRERSVERQLCGMATTSALAIAARRLLIVCDIGQTSADERTRALRWVRGLAHRIGYECSVNGLHGLATWYTAVVAGTDRAQAARSVVEWYRRGHLP